MGFDDDDDDDDDAGGDDDDDFNWSLLFQGNSHATGFHGLISLLLQLRVRWWFPEGHRFLWGWHWRSVYPPEVQQETPLKSYGKPQKEGRSYSKHRFSRVYVKLWGCIDMDS